MSWYSTGSVSVSNGSATVNGSGTGWFGALQNGWAFVGPDGRIYEIQSISDAGTLGLATAYQGATAAAQSYAAYPTHSLDLDLAASIQSLISNYQSVYDGAGQGKFSDGTLAAPGLRFVADQDSGIRRISSNTWALVAGATDIVTLFNNRAEIQALENTPIGQATPAAAKFTDVEVTGSLAVSSPVNTPMGIASTDAICDIGIADSDGSVKLRSRNGEFSILTGGAAGDTSGAGSAVKMTVQSDGAVSLTDGKLTLNGNKIGGGEITIANNAVGSITPPRTGGFVKITASGETATPAHNFSADLWFDLGTSLRLEKNTGWSNVGDNVAVLATLLTGTTGVDGDVSCAAQPAEIQIENRSGVARTFHYTYE